MPDKLEEVIKAAYGQWKSELPQAGDEHPDEEIFACFLENKLSAEEDERIKAHIISCKDCLDTVLTYLTLHEGEVKDVPEELLGRVKGLFLEQGENPVLDIFLLLKEKALEIINTSGDVLVGQEFIPAPVLRTRSIKDFKDEVTILKDFKDLRVEAKIENKLGKAFNLSVTVKDKVTQKTMKDLRVSLIKDDVELESYVSDSGKVVFEHVLLGKYVVEILGVEKKIASVILDIKQ
ncbi:MAG: zf-HC2 domain-containing protein [Candidatus Omnitrophica bacterium]|nr:zf-HC2 domain-containing protein [Candidatus Omnitrophota bacterium]MBU1869820.1 zf-HC2 domain-containing protein [Candidatus Omnitrophota bacterium]